MLISGCVLATVIGVIIITTFSHPRTASVLLNGPWHLVSADASSSTWRTHRDEDGVRIQMRRAYRLVNEAGLPIRRLQIRLHEADRILLDLQQPGPVIAFGAPQLQSDDATPWHPLIDTTRDTRLEIEVVVDRSDVPNQDLPFIETRIKPDTWTNWPRFSNR